MTTTADYIDPRERVLDWQRRFSPKSLPFKIAAQQPQIVTLLPRTRNWLVGYWLNQLRLPGCTGFGAEHCMGARPRSSSTTDDMAATTYYEAQRRDQWAGENYEGSSVLGAMEAELAFKRIKAYWWGTTLKELIVGVANYGPMEDGIDWYDGMFEPNADGFLEPTGGIAGGHAFCRNGVNLRWLSGTSDAAKRSEDWFEYLNLSDSFFRIHNSWGKGWGENGEAKIRLVHYRDVFIPQRGEFALPRKPRVAA